MVLLAIPLLSAIYLALPADGAARTIVYPAYGLIATLAILIGVRRQRPVRAGSWRLIAAAIALLTAGDIIYTVLVIAGGEVPYPSLSDVGYLAGYIRSSPASSA